MASAELVASRELPDIAFEGFARGRLESAGIGALSTFIDCAVAPQGACGGDFCGPALILWLGICTVAAPVGGAVGAVIAPSASEVRAAEGELRAALERNPIQQRLREGVIAAARAEGDALAIGPSDAASRIEVGLRRVGTEGSGIDPPLTLVMSARVRVLRAADSGPLFEADFEHRGGARRLAEWSADHGAPLTRAIEVGYAELGAQIFERLFRLYPYPDRATHWGLLRSDFGLAALDPVSRLHVPDVASRRPTLSWQSFPRASDLSAAPREMERVANVRYDLRVARVGPDAPAAVVYRRDGLPEPRHTLEKPLAPHSGYLWSVRARFDLDGRTHVTEWSGVGRVGSDEPDPSWFRFETP